MKTNHFIPENKQYSLDVINIGDRVTDISTGIQGDVQEIIKHYRKSGHSYKFIMLCESFIHGAKEYKTLEYKR